MKCPTCDGKGVVDLTRFAIGARLRTLRGSKPQKEIARALDCDAAQLSRIERGLNNLTLTRAKKAADFFGLSLDELIG